MTDMEMDLYITQSEGRILKKTVQEQEDEIANLKNHVKALQNVIERQQGCINHLLLLELGGDLNG
jgi:polyhydroxyalkanoate synthesis regulator protein